MKQVLEKLLPKKAEAKAPPKKEEELTDEQKKTLAKQNPFNAGVAAMQISDRNKARKRLLDEIDGK